MLATNTLPDTERIVAGGQHLIAAIRGRDPGPTLVVVCSLHGNEPAGVVAARRLCAWLRRAEPLLRGEVVLLAQPRFLT